MLRGAEARMMTTLSAWCGYELVNRGKGCSLRNKEDNLRPKLWGNKSEICRQLLHLIFVEHEFQLLISTRYDEPERCLRFRQTKRKLCIRLNTSPMWIQRSIQPKRDITGSFNIFAHEQSLWGFSRRYAFQTTDARTESSSISSCRFSDSWQLLLARNKKRAQPEPLDSVRAREQRQRKRVAATLKKLR
jgi:hypothetical protein